MKKVIALFLCFLLVAFSLYATPKLLNYILFGPQSGFVSSAFSSASGMRIDGADEKIAFKFYAATTSAITDIDFYANITGDVTGVNFKAQIETDSSDAPSGVALGQDTPSFAGPAADGWVGLQTLDTNTGALTQNTPYWVVIYEDGTGADPDGSNHVNAMEEGTGYRWCADRIRHHDTTNWTNTAARSEPSVYVVKHLDGTYSGFPQDSATAASPHTHIFSTNRQGVKVTFGSKVTVQGFLAAMDKVSSPGNVTVKLYEGSTQRAVSNAVAPGEIGDRSYFIYWFTTPYETSSGTIYITVEQDGVSGANDYNFVGEAYSQSAYKEAIMPANFDFIYGSGADPTAYSVSSEWTPRCALIITDPGEEFDEAAGGGGQNATGAIAVGF